jgi:peptidoglycan pentaglycine glycine transferase (the first glycine)
MPTRSLEARPAASLDVPEIVIRLEPASCPIVWDSAITALAGSVLQSWRWGAFKADFGWEVERLHVEHEGGVGLAQILIRRHGPFSIAYLPRGPVLPAHDQRGAHALFETIDAFCRRRGVISLIVEPDRPFSLAGCGACHDFLPGPRPFQPARTVKVPLVDDAGLLAQMRRDTRANVRHAERNGVQVERAVPTPRALQRFYALLAETGGRNGFEVHGLDYYTALLRHFGDDALLAFARSDGEDAVGLIALRHGAEAVYLYGGSSVAHRVRGAASLLQLDAMRWARDAGCVSYDLWGIPDHDPPAADLARGQVAASHGQCMDGLYQFKVGFGGNIVSFSPTLERRYRPFLTWVAQQRFPRYRPAAPCDKDGSSG